MYVSEERLAKLFIVFTYLAIAVACLGLFGLVEFSVNQRAKEISIRKVFGAGLLSLLILVTKRYFGLMLISCALVLPLVYMVAVDWLNQFAYRVQLGPLIFLQSAGLIMLITAVTVSFQSARAALADPIRNLRNE